MATFESGGFSMALKKIATDSADSAYNPRANFSENLVAMAAIFLLSIALLWHMIKGIGGQK